MEANKPTRNMHKLLISALSASLALNAGPASGADALEPMVVEASPTGSIQLHESSSSTRLESLQLQDSNVEALMELEKLVPGLKLSTQGTARFSINSLRGLGDVTRQDYFNSSIAVLVDGIYVPTAALDMSLLNIDHIEVLRGPQTARFGRNAIAGAINIVTRRPADAQGSDVSLTAGNKDRIAGSITTTTQLSDTLFGRLTIRKEQYDGFIHNLDDGKPMDDRDDLTLNGELQLKLDDRWSSSLKVSKIDKTVGNNGNQPYASYNNYVTDVTGGNQEDFDIKSAALSVNYAGDDLDFKSITSIRDYRVLMAMDLGYTQAPGMPAGGAFPKGMLSNSVEDGEYYNQTFEISNTPKSKGGTEWLAGLQLTKDNKFYEYVMGRMFELETDYTRKDYAAYAESTWHLNPFWSLTAAARYTVEKHDANGKAYMVDGSTGATVIMPISGKNDEHLFTPRAELAYKPDTNTTLFTSIARGIRGGGLNRIQMLQPFEKETVTTTELGIKKYLPDSGLTLATSLFYNDWKDMQIKQFFNGGASYSITNAGKATSYGLDLEANWHASRNLNLFLNGTLVESEFDEFMRNSGADLSGNHIPNIPEHSLTVGGVWRKPSQWGGQWMASADYAWKGRHYFDAENRLSDKYGLLNAQFGLEQDDWQLYFWAKNLLDEDHLTYAYQDDFKIDVAAPGRGREWGLRLKAQF